MTETDKLFFELIRVAIGNQVCLSRTPKVKEWQELYAMAKKQSLVGICFAGVQKLQAQRQAPNSWGDERGEMLYLQWMGMAAKIQQRNEVVNRRCEEVQRLINSEGLKCCIIKGQCAGRYYGELSALRLAGDIDVWIEGGRKKVLEYVQKVAPTCEVIMQHAHLNVFDDVEVEAHFSPSELQSPIHNRRLQKWFKTQEQKETCLVADGFSGPSAEFDAIFMLSHIYKHLMAEGIGMRQVMDYYFLLKHAAFDVEKKVELMKLIDYFGMKRLADAMMWILKDVFGLDERFLLCPVDKLEGGLILDEIMASGNFGHMDGRRGKMNGMMGRLIEPRLLTWKLAKSHPLEYMFTPINRIIQRIWMMINGYKAKE